MDAACWYDSPGGAPPFDSWYGYDFQNEIGSPCFIGTNCPAPLPPVENSGPYTQTVAVFGEMVAQRVPGCPTSVTLSSITPFSLPLNFPTWQTGIGILSFMQINPATTNFDGTQLTEYVSTNINSCQNAPISTCNVFGNSLTIGTKGGPRWGLSWNAQHDIMWDEHSNTAPTSVLNAPGVNISACTVSCIQTYYCGPAAVGTFTILYDFNRGTIDGTPVTNVTVTKQ